jgi:hypothetical protein
MSGEDKENKQLLQYITLSEFGLFSGAELSFFFQLSSRYSLQSF